MTYLENAWREGRIQAAYMLAESQRIDPDTTPYGVAAIHDSDHFAGACYSENLLSDLDLTDCKKSDDADRRAWNLSAYDWAYQIGIAYAALTWNVKHNEEGED